MFVKSINTGTNPSVYNYNSTYRSIVCDASFVNQISSYFIKLPTNLSNGSIIYIQVATVGTAQLGIMGGATIQDNIYYGPNQWKGYEYAASPTIYKFIHHLQIIHGMETLITRRIHGKLIQYPIYHIIFCSYIT